MKRLRILVVAAAVVCAVVFVATLAPLQAQVGKPQGLLDANRATEEQLATVPHLNAALVKAIVDKRPFANVTELAAVLTQIGRVHV